MEVADKGPPLSDLGWREQLGSVVFVPKMKTPVHTETSGGVRSRTIVRVPAQPVCEAGTEASFGRPCGFCETGSRYRLRYPRAEPVPSKRTRSFQSLAPGQRQIPTGARFEC